MKKPIAVHFGAGNIGRGFVGELLFKSGYQVYFLDVNEEIIRLLEQKKSFDVLYANTEKTKSHVEIAHAYHSISQKKEAIEILMEADIITTAVGVSILPRVAPLMKEAMVKRQQQNKKPVNIIACENAVNASETLKPFVLGEGVDPSLVGFPNAAVDRIVPDQNNENPLDVLVEPYFEWVIETKHIVGEHQKIQGATYVKDITPYIERKLFTVNTGHAVCAYAGAAFGHGTIQQGMKDPKVVQVAKQVLMETGAYLVKTYGFSQADHEKYIAKILGRFSNENIVDEISRVARGSIRKLSPGDRLMKPMVGYFNLFQSIPTGLCQVTAFAYGYRDEKDEEASALQKYIQEHGIVSGIEHYSGLQKDTPLALEIVKFYESFQQETT